MPACAPAARFRRPLAAALTLAAGGFAFRVTAAAPPEPFRLEAFLPATTLAFASVDGLGGDLERRFRATDLGLLAAEPDVRAFAGPALDGVSRWVKDVAEGRAPGAGGLGPFAARVLRALDGLHGQAAVALVDLAEGEPAVICASLDFGGRLSEAVEFLSRLSGEDAADGAPSVAAVKIGDRSAWRIGANQTGPEFVATTVGTAVVASTDGGWLEKVVLGGGVPASGPLAALPSFRAVREASRAEGAGLSVYAAAGRFAAQGRPEGWAHAWTEALGLHAEAAVGYALAFAGTGFLESAVLHARMSSRLWRSLSDTRTGIGGDALGLAPSGTAVCIRLRPRMREVRSAVFKLAELAGPEAVAGLEAVLERATSMFGGDPSVDFLERLRGDLAAWIALPEDGGVFPEVVFASGTGDSAGLEAYLLRAVDSFARWAETENVAKVAPRTIAYHGERIHVVDLDADGDRPAPRFTPTWALLGNRLVVTLVPHTMKDYILRREIGPSGDAPAPAEREDVQALLAATPGAGAFAFLDTKALAACAYDTGAPLLQTLVGGEAKRLPFALDLAALPPTRVVAPHLHPLGLSVATDAEGLRVESRGPFPILAAAAAVVAWLLAEAPPATPPDLVSPPVPVPETPSRPGVAVAPDEREAAARRALDTALRAVAEYARREGRLPASLLDVVEKAGLLDAVPKDAEGRPVRYRAETATRHVWLWLPGPDGVDGTKDDPAVDAVLEVPR